MCDLTGDLSLIMIQAIHVHVCMLMTYTSRGFPSHNFKCYIYIGIIKRNLMANYIKLMHNVTVMVNYMYSLCY